MGEIVTVDVEGGPMDIHVAAPAGIGPFPGVLVMHHRDGIDTFTKTFCDDLAAQGYVAAAPDLFHAMPPGGQRHAYREFLFDRGYLKDIGATVAHLGGRGDVRSDRLAIVGHCMGGHVAWIGGLTLAAFKALVVYYGGDVRKAWGDDGAAPIDLVAQATCPIIGFFGKEDRNPSPADMEALSAVLDGHGKDYEFHAYDGAGHAFQNFESPDRYHREAAEDSRRRMMAFLDRQLRPAS